MAKNETLDVIEETVDAIDETLDLIEKNKNLVVPVAVVVGITGLLAGGAIGYLVAKKQLTIKYEKLAEQEIAEAKAFYNRLTKEEKTPSETVSALRPSSDSLNEATDALRSYQGDIESQDDAPDVEVDVNVNVFSRTKTDSELTPEEIDARTPGEPYIISHDEYMEAEPGYEQTVLTYYEGDQTLADDKDQPIELIDEVVGEGNVTRFGLASGDANTIFIRNERLTMDFEVVRSEGKFAHEVLGLQHSDEFARRDRRAQNQPGKFRGGYE